MVSLKTAEQSAGDEGAGAGEGTSAGDEGRNDEQLERFDMEGYALSGLHEDTFGGIHIHYWIGTESWLADVGGPWLLDLQREGAASRSAVSLFPFPSSCGSAILLPQTDSLIFLTVVWG